MHKVAERVINKCGGVQKVAKMLGMTPQAIYKWTYPFEAGGSNGLIPTKRIIELMVAAKHHGINLEPEDFFPRMPKSK
jgi:transposase